MYTNAAKNIRLPQRAAGRKTTGTSIANKFSDLSKTYVQSTQT